MMHTKHNHVATEVLSLKKIGGYQFSIPSYQRPYVWSEQDVKQLFDDIVKANDSNESGYFIGTVLSSKHQSNNTYELVDGQQRTTTLMLIAIAFKKCGIDCELANVAALGSSPRLQFDIRDEVQQLMGSYCQLDNFNMPSAERINENPYLKNIGAALTVLQGLVAGLSNKQIDDCRKQLASISNENKQTKQVLTGQLTEAINKAQQELADFIYEKVFWVNNIVPEQMDLNRIFATMNTSGMQLEQTDMLKAKLFKCIDSDKALYEQIWLACEHMENYFERNVRKLFTLRTGYTLKIEDLAYFNRDVFLLSTETKDKQHEAFKKRSVCRNESGLTISELFEELEVDGEFVANLSEKNSVKGANEELDMETVLCESIISFPLLLIHCYRIYLARKNQQDISPRFHTDNLIEIFKPLIAAKDKSAIKEFIELLWQVRYLFDKHVIKWLEHDNDSTRKLAIAKIDSSVKDNKYINRSEQALDELTMLQSVRYYTSERNTQYWLTPFLGLLLNKECQKSAIELLEDIDNQLSLTTETQKEASYALAQKSKLITDTWQEKSHYFNEPRGTGFNHYWFQKLEYLLWKSETNRTDKPFLSFRITSKNSVEHVHPQRRKAELNNDVMLDSFGNLVLLNPSENSSYGAQSVHDKENAFWRKASNGSYDSLKLKAMFDLKAKHRADWGQELIEQHKGDMLEILKQHYQPES